MTPGSTIEKLLQSTGMKIILLIITCGFLLGPAGSALSATISGTVSLPGGATAPAGGIDVDVSAFNINDPNYDDFYSVSVTIAPGTSSKAYSIPVSDDTNASWEVYYYYWGGEYVQGGYYSINGTTWDYSAKTLLPGGQDHPDIDLVLLTGNTISGTVSLPSGDTAPAGGIDVDIRCGWGSVSVSIEVGNSSAPYSMTVRDDTTASWEVDYQLWEGGKYIPNGYYSATGTTWDNSGVTLLPGGQDHPDINLVLLTGNTIRGTISLPSRQTAPTGGLWVEISVQNSNNSVFEWIDVNIDEGQTSTTYSIGVPDNANFSWKVNYSIWDESMYFDTGYYSSNGTTWDDSAATTLVGGIDYDDINLTLLALKKKGMLCFPVRSKDGQISIISM